MIAQRLQLVERICLQALETEPAARASFLRDTCPDDEIRAEVESLLDAAGFADDFFRAPALFLSSSTGADPGEPPAPQCGDEIGPYRLLERLGEGGMGVVYRAIQAQPVRREVALKIVRPGIQSAAAAARFGAERQALSLMDHPNIARVLDVGATTGGRAYFVMELVAGRPINKYCGEHGLTVRERAQLMVRVCQAIQHAHQKGVIHRDIKPSNILVADSPAGPTPKIIDFGIAKANGASLYDGATFTRAFDVIGTLEYMSPEQAEPGGQGLDVRSDVYSLGAVLYELLAGQPPIPGLSLRNTGFAEVLRRIHDEIPPPPSNRARKPTAPQPNAPPKPDNLVSEPRPQGSVPPPPLRHSAECDWIALKALEKDRDRRYESAGAMAHDLDRYLAGHPVEACPPTRLYRLRKFAARHRLAFSVSAAFVALLVVAVVWMSIALREQMLANTNTAALREVVRKVAIDGTAQIAQLPNSLKIRSSLLGDVEDALQTLSKETGHDRDGDLQLARAYYNIALVRGAPTSDGSMGDFAAGLKYLNRSAAIAAALIRANPSDRDAQKMFLGSRLAALSVYRRLQRYPEAGQAAREIVAHAQALPPSMHRQDFFVDYDIVTAYKEIAAIKTSQGKFDESLALNRSALSIARTMAPKWLQSPLVKNNLAAAYADTALSEWRLHGYSPDASALIHQGLAVVQSCPDLMCKSRAAELEGYAGLIDWSGGREKEGFASLERGIHDMEALSAAQSGDVLFKTAADSLRESYALALVASHRRQQALAVLRNRPSPADPHADPESLLVYGEVLEAIGGRASGEPYFLAASRGLDKDPAQGFEPDLLRWDVTRALAECADRTRHYADSLRLRRDSLSLAAALPADPDTVRIFTSTSAADFAHTVAETPNATPALRHEALRLLAGCCSAVPNPYRVEQLGAIVTTPSPEQLHSLTAALTRP